MRLHCDNKLLTNFRAVTNIAPIPSEQQLFAATAVSPAFPVPRGSNYGLIGLKKTESPAQSF